MSVRVKIQKFGSALSSMVIPNLGAFMAWGLLTAVAIAINSDGLRMFISPMLNDLLPLLIAVAAGKMVYDYRGAVIAAVAVMGVIIGADITMFIGAMIMGPLAAWCLKRFDRLIDGKIPLGFELLINNFSVAVLGAVLAVLGKEIVAPAIVSLTGIMAGGVDFLVAHRLLPLTAIFIEPAKILFLNNAIGQGILSPLGSTQLAELGKSVLYLLESNPGPGMGVLLAYCVAGKGNSKSSAMGASVIHFFGGIHEIYFPFILMNPILVLALICGGLTGTFLFTVFHVGLVGVASPGSIISIMLMSAMGDHLKILISILAACAVSFLVAVPLVRRADNSDEKLEGAAKTMEGLKGKKSSVASVFTGTLEAGTRGEKRAGMAEEPDYGAISRIAYACDAGIGSSAMGAAVLQKKLKRAGIGDVEVFHIAIQDLPVLCQMAITHKSLTERAKEKMPDTYFLEIADYLNAPEYDALVEKIRQARGGTGC